MELKFKWSVKRATVVSIEERQRVDGVSQEIKKYAIVKLSPESPAPEGEEGKMLGRKVKLNTIMCFSERLWELLQVNQRYNMTGVLSFGRGNTFLCVESAYDMLGQDIEQLSLEEILPY